MEALRLWTPYSRWKYREPHECPARVCRKAPKSKACTRRNDLFGRITALPESPIKGNVKRNASPSARCRYFVRHSAQLFETCTLDSRVVFLRPSRLFRSGV